MKKRWLRFLKNLSIIFISLSKKYSVKSECIDWDIEPLNKILAKYLNISIIVAPPIGHVQNS